MGCDFGRMDVTSSKGAQQLSGSGIDLCKMGEPGVPTVLGWLKEHLKTDMTLGFDGRLHDCGNRTFYG